MPYWLLTSTTYGTWLPGDTRGSVTSVRDVRPGEGPSPVRREHSVFGEPYEPPSRPLHQSARRLLVAPPVRLTRDQALVVVRQFVDTAAFRGWRLVAAAVMANHFHVVLGVRDEADPRKLLTDLKAYASRGLNAATLDPTNESPSNRKWWTRNGSRRRLPDQAGLDAAENYVLRKQQHPLALWPTSEAPPKHAREP
ncbi:MAG: hypothetical protein ACRCT8_00715 [Lacipirellulaceae bacterium]